MAKVYVVIPSHDGVSDSERADKISIEWWSITRPDSVKSSGDVTKRRFSAIQHPTTSAYAFVADDDLDIRVHSDFDPSDLVNLCSELTDSEASTLTTAINDAKGGTISSDTLLISNWTRLTQAQADSAGWIPSSNP